MRKDALVLVAGVIVAPVVLLCLPHRLGAG